MCVVTYVSTEYTSSIKNLYSSIVILFNTHLFIYLLQTVCSVPGKIIKITQLDASSAVMQVNFDLVHAPLS